MGIDKLQNALFPDFMKARAEGKCPFCERLVSEGDFRDTISKKEHSISGMCQECQDSFFDEDDEESLDYKIVESITKEMTPSRVNVALDRIMDIIFHEVYLRHEEVENLLEEEIEYGDGPSFGEARPKIKDVLKRLQEEG